MNSPCLRTRNSLATLELDQRDSSLLQPSVNFPRTPESFRFSLVAKGSLNVTLPSPSTRGPQSRLRCLSALLNKTQQRAEFLSSLAVPYIILLGLANFTLLRI